MLHPSKILFLLHELVFVSMCGRKLGAFDNMQLGCQQKATMRESIATAVIRAIDELKARGYVKGGQQVAIVQSGRQPIWRSASTHAIQVSVSASKQQNCCSSLCCWTL